MSVIPWYVTVVRLLVPISILRWPLWGVLAAVVADMYDWKFVSVVTDQDLALYQAWDKGMDFYYWLFILWVVWKWKDIWAKRVAVGLFLFRMIGMGIFWLTQSRLMLFVFPNVFENFVIWCWVLFWLTRKQKLVLSKLQKIFMLLGIGIPKLLHEYFMHFLVKQPWEIYDVGVWLSFDGMVKEYANYIVWGGLFYLSPLVAFCWMINALQRQKR